MLFTRSKLRDFVIRKSADLGPSRYKLHSQVELRQNHGSSAEEIKSHTMILAT